VADDIDKATRFRKVFIPDIAIQLDRLKSPSKDKRYEAYEGVLYLIGILKRGGIPVKAEPKI
jgi:hypothetical protein